VRDEAERLPACLASARGLGAELVVVDTGSTDGTLEIARAAGARLRQIAWPHDFSAARNAGLELASGRWILVLDADETLPPESVRALRAITDGPAAHACALVQRNALPGGTGHLSVGVVRLFPNLPGVRFERPIHERVNASLERMGIRIVDTDVVFDHSGHADLRLRPIRIARERELIEAALTREPEADPNLRYYHASTFFDAGDHARAAEEYAACAQASEGRRRRLAEAARIKQAECLSRLGRASEAVALLAREPSTETHPLACELRAAEAAARGAAEEARRWRERLLGIDDAAYLPPVALKPMQIRALEALAERWYMVGRKDAAVRVLHLGLDLAHGRLAVGRAVAAAYARALLP
jgi:hypothetical protein